MAGRYSHIEARILEASQRGMGRLQMPPASNWKALFRVDPGWGAHGIIECWLLTTEPVVTFPPQDSKYSCLSVSVEHRFQNVPLLLIPESMGAQVSFITLYTIYTEPLYILLHALNHF